MTMRRIWIHGVLVIGLAIITCSTVGAAFVDVAEFDGLILGPIDDQNGWFADDLSSEVALDPADLGNQVLSIPTSSTFLFHTAIIPEGEARMLFFRFRYEDQLSVSFGMSESVFPDQFGNFEPELSLTSSNDNLRINDDGTYDDLTELEPGQWYNCWLYIDNGADVTSVWLHECSNEPAAAADQLMIDGRTEFPFRQGTANDLRNIFIKTGGGDGVAGPLLLDDIALTNIDALDLSNPIAPVSHAAMQTSQLQLLGAVPNPFNPSTRLSFEIVSSGHTRLKVFDAAGRLVKTLVDEHRDTGRHEVIWDGRDGAGRMSSAGVYLYRLEAAGLFETKRMTLVK